ncbi:MAG: type II toxin-antitoxin system Phd/YefM family antitoxin [Bacteroidetes bacterium]|nr:MAG: type II toxin-antitoxin system Phd/YefM family antitoxin [Bacteroidota bacterium]
MIPSEAIKPISYFKTHASEIIRDVSNSRKTMIITQNGEAKAILQDIKLYEQTQDSLALLKILALSSKSLNDGKVKPIKDAFHDIKEKIKRLNGK